MKLSRNRNGGFTLPEVLLTTAILIVLLALSSVEVAKYRNELKLTELDNMAREIYMAAQNRAVLLKNSLRLDALLDTTAKELPEGANATEAEGKDCVYIKSDSAAASELLPLGSVDPALRNGKFYIVYEPVSGSVTDVFYAESGELPGIKDAFDLASNRAERLKYSPMLGYYGGGMRAEIGTIPLPTPGVEVLIENGNELVLTVIYSLPEGLPDKVTRTPSVTLDYQDKKVDLLSPENSDRLVQKDDINGTGTTATYRWTLDSMDYYDKSGNRTAGLHFKDLFAEDNTPSELGGEFTVTASLKLSKDGYIESSYSAKDSDNSLFDTTSTDEDGNATNRIACIANLRHLQNLDNFTSGAAGKAAAIQLADIDAGTVMDNEGRTKGQEDTYKFLPIENWDLKSYKADSPTLGAEPYSIRNLRVTAEDYLIFPPAKPGENNVIRNAALFSAVAEGFRFENVRLMDSDIRGITNAGGLTGSAPSVTFTDCGVLKTTVVAGSKTSGGYAGGLAGVWWLENKETSLPIRFENCRAEGIIVEGFNSSGGLVGGGPDAEFTGCTVQDASITVFGWAGAGGLTGTINGVEDTYKNCHVVNATIDCQPNAAGGLVGSIGDENTKTHVTFIDCTVENGIILAGQYAGGLTGNSNAESGQFEKCSASKTTVGNTVTTPQQAGGLAGRATSIGFTECEATDVTVSAMYYAGGLVGFGNSATFSDCKAVNAAVHATDTAAGGLAGRIEDSSILSGCQVYWDKEHLSDLKKDGTLQYQVTAVTAGGLVGQMAGSPTITSSFVATLVRGSTFAGGLAGNIASNSNSTVTIQNSYADCYLWAGESIDYSSAGGLIGVKEDWPNGPATLNMTNVYATGSIEVSIGSASGLCGGGASNTTAQNAYAAMKYNVKPTYELANGVYSDLLCGRLGMAKSNCHYLVDNGDWNGLTYNEMCDLTMGGDFESKTSTNTHPYNLDGNNRTGVAYPFPGLKGLDHYGDWYTE